MTCTVFQSSLLQIQRVDHLDFYGWIWREAGVQPVVRVSSHLPQVAYCPTRKNCSTGWLAIAQLPELIQVQVVSIGAIQLEELSQSRTTKRTLKPVHLDQLFQPCYHLFYQFKPHSIDSFKHNSHLLICKSQQLPKGKLCLAKPSWYLFRKASLFSGMGAVSGKAFHMM